MQEVVELGVEKCEYRSWETVGGPAAWVVAYMRPIGGVLRN